jgi:type II secretory pathway component GspD/PulD (secretin)
MIHRRISLLSLALMLLVGCLLACSVDRCRGDESTDLLKLLATPSVVEKLGVSKEVGVSLKDFLERRQAEWAQQDVALKNAPAKLRADKLAEFEKTTLEKSLQMLTEDQRATLHKMILAKQGFSALANADVAMQLRLTEEQKESIQEIMTERAEKIAGLEEAEQVEAMNLVYEARLENLLEARQLQGWRVLTGEIDEKAAAEDLLAKVVVAEDTADQPPVPDPANVAGEKEPVAVVAKPVKKKVVFDPNKKLNFSFGDEDWLVVIEWFADQAGLNLKMESVPEGTLRYQSDREYTLKEAMDFLNNQLLAMDHTLVRYDDLLTVVDLANGIPPSVIETVTPEELDERGKYEIVKCAFEFKDVNGSDFAEEVKPLINTEKGQGQMFYFASSNRMVVQETGEKLRTIRSFLKIAEDRAKRLKGDIVKVELKYVNGEELMMVARPLFGMRANENSVSKDEMRLSVVAEPLGNRLWIDGTPELVDRFKSLVEQFDVEAEAIEATTAEGTSIVKYRTKIDPVVVEQILRRMFGTEQGMRLARDEITGFILVEGSPTQHEMVVKALLAIDGEASVTKILTLTKKSASDVITLLSSLLRITTDEAGKPVGTLVLEEDPDENKIIVRGTPQEVAEVESIIQTMDPPIGSSEYERSELRVIPFSPSAASRALESSSNIWSLTGRENKVTYVVPGKGEFNPANPEELKKLLGRQDVVMPAESNDSRAFTTDELRQMFPQLDIPELPPATNQRVPAEEKSQPKSESPPKSDEQDPKKTPEQNSAQRVHVPVQYVAAVIQTTETQSPTSQSGNVANENAPVKQDAGVPGAPITVQVTRSEILLYSKDLDALDDMERLLTQSESSSLLAEDPTVFLLEHRSPEEAKTMLEDILGISSGGGGAGGGIAGMMGNMAQNMLGPAGEMMGGLLGGGSSGSSNVLRTYGDVTIVADPHLNGLIVYAGDEDLDQVKMLLKIIDQEAPHDPRLDGKTYVIPIVHVNATDLVTIIKEQLAARIKGTQEAQGGGGGGQNAQAEILRALMQGGGRRGGGGGGGGGTQIEQPKFAITAYSQANWILVTGPEFLYRQVQDIVLLLDTEKALAGTPVPVIIPKTGLNAALLEEALKAAFGDKIQTEVVAQGTGSTSGNTGTQNSSATTGRAEADDANAAFRAAIMQRMQQGGGGGGFPGGGGGQPGGGGFPGGGGRGGGGRGGR